MPSYWLEGSPIHRPTRERLAETARIADEFLAADDAAYEATGTEATNAAMEAAMDVVSEAEDAVENFPARSFADLVVIASLAKVQIGLESISDDFCGILANHILALSKAET